MLEEQKREITENGMKDPRLQELAEKEKEDALAKIEKQKDEQIQLVRDDLMSRLRF